MVKKKTRRAIGPAPEREGAACRVSCLAFLSTAPLRSYLAEGRQHLPDDEYWKLAAEGLRELFPEF